jgi:large subunit ribosomal protein L21
MYAVIETGGKQYRVELGTEIEIDRLDVTAGETIELGRVLLVADGDNASIGRPVVDGARVSANVVRQDRGDKIVVFKYRPKARTRVKHGHRQDLTIVRIADIQFNGRSAAEEAEKASVEQARADAAAAEAAERQAATDRALADKLAREQAEKEAAAAAAEKADTKATKRGSRSRAAKATADKTEAAEPAGEPESTDADADATEAKPKPRRSTKKDE